MQWLAVAMGGAIGALGRFAVNAWLYPITGGKFPLGTFAVNIAGSLLMGICYVVIIEKGAVSPYWRDFMMVGFLGAFTTFSAFSLDALALWQNGHLALSAAYVIASVIFCLFGALLAIYITRLF